MIRENDPVLLTGKKREYFVTAGSGEFSTDKGMIDLASLVGMKPGETVKTHLGVEFVARLPRPTDFFVHARRSGAPMLPKDIGMVVAATGMNKKDEVLDAGTGSGIAAIYFGGIAASVVSCEIREDFANLARKNISLAGLDNVTVVHADVLDIDGSYDVVHLDLHVGREHIEYAHAHLRPGGYLATYTPFLEQTFLVIDTAEELFSQVECHELIDRHLSRSQRGTRPSTRVCHSGYITIARK